MSAQERNVNQVETSWHVASLRFNTMQALGSSAHTQWQWDAEQRYSDSFGLKICATGSSTEQAVISL